MTNHSHSHNQGGFLQGLILGLILGGGAVFLFGTKTGRKLLKTITEEGFDKVSDITELLDDLGEDEDYGDDEEEYEEEEHLPEKVLEPKVNAYTKPVDVHPSEVTHAPSSKPRRLFRGVPRRH